jgi:N-acetylglutamate synthase-like GNAT family acetyltransferase
MNIVDQEIPEVNFCLVESGSQLHVEAMKIREEELRASFNRTVTKEEIEAQKDDFQIIGWLKNDDKELKKEVVSTCLVVIEEVEDGSKLARVKHVAVTKKCQSQGIGKKMVKFVHDFCKENQYFSIYCVSRTSAFGFYTKLGYKQVGETFLFDGYLECARFEKNLSQD